MDAALTIRRAEAADIAAVDALLSRSYPALLKADYPPSAMVTALPIISRVQPTLVLSGSYFVVEGEGGALLAAGGWTAAPRAEPGSQGLAHVRHVVTDHRHVRRGIGRHLMSHVARTARRAGHARLTCLSTRTAVPFYAALGFAREREIEIDLRPGIVFSAVRMHRLL